MTLHYQFITVSAFILLSLTSVDKDKLQSTLRNVCNVHLNFANSIVDGDKCNTFGYDKYVQNSDVTAAYSVTVKVVSFKAGEGSKEFQKVVSVPAGGKTYVGCSVSPETGGPSYTYTVVGESKL